MCIENAKNIGDVVGIPGRITHVFGKVVPVGEPSYGGSRYYEELVELAKELGYTVSFFDRRKEPKEVKQVEGKTMEWAASEIFKNAGKPLPK